VLVAMRRATTITTTAVPNTQKNVEYCGIPGRPRAAPMASMFKISTRMISPKPSVTMAR
jgi:hypothetical protein